KLRRQLRQGLLSRKRRHRHSRLEFRAVLLSLYAHVSRPLDRSALSLSCCPKIRSRRILNAPPRTSQGCTDPRNKVIHAAGRDVARSNVHCLEAGPLQDTLNRIKRRSRSRLSYVIDLRHERPFALDSASSFGELLFCVSAYIAKSFSRRSVSFLNI